MVNAVASNISRYEFEDLTPPHFEVRSGNRVTLFQDAHCEGDYPAPIVKPDGTQDTSYVPQNCFEQIYTFVAN